MAHRRDSTPTSDGLGTKRKRLPACDCCKMRRLKCDPVPPPASCSRCKTTGVVCTTTPVVRKKAVPRSGKRIEEAKATFGTADPDAPDFMGASNTPWMQPSQSSVPEALATSVREPSVSQQDVDARLAAQELDGALVAHLLELYQTFPQSWLPIGARGRIAHQFEAAGRRLDALPPQAEVLALVTIALSSRLSSHPALFSPGASSIPSCTTLTPDVLATQPDLREFGHRREAACEDLRRRAVELAWQRGTLVETCDESLASCYLLEMLEGYKDPAAGKPYGSAFVSHLQTILNAQDSPGAPTKVINMSLGWSALIMREALLAANTRRTSHFTATDDLLLCGEVPGSVDEALLKSVDDVDVRDSVTLFFSPMRPFTFHVARLARECGENVSGTAARRQPFNEPFVAKYLTQLDHLLHLFAILEARIAYVLSPAASAAHALPAPFETERTFIMRACLHTLGLAWAALSLPVHTELRRRLAALRDEDGFPPAAASAGAAATQASERRRAIERLEVLQRQVGATALKAARMVAQCVHEAPSLAFLTQLRSEYLERWVEVLREARTEEDGGGEGISREQKERDLSWLLGGLKTMGWAWSDGAPLISRIEHALDDLAHDRHQRRASEMGANLYDVHHLDVKMPSPSPVSMQPTPSGLPAVFSAPPFATGSYASSSTPAPAATPISSYSAPPQPPRASAHSPGMGSFFAPPPPPPAPHPRPPHHHQLHHQHHQHSVARSSAPPLSTVFAGAPTPPSHPHAHSHPHSQAQAHPPTPSQAPPPPPAPPLQPSSGMPDLFELVSLYSSGSLDPLIGQATSAGMDVNALAAQYLDGTFDLPSLLGQVPSMASGVPMSGFVTAPSAGSAAGGGAGTGGGQQPDPGEFDLASLLAEPVFAPTPRAQD
ncbi:uncharacterized protein RHOBADRAFT_55358 [Rhodotorula graminis WP1]|uniref:Zn(2)-C6 fungal-type domain-containing protein n=1 Tax=Rhodotorula graminis (strain WP1) TaxID=578459 RepID=A0A0P9IUL1_RHOGW|nr:uncharacterized protein RHOBADRAFT_55358 [Rhodotorula graminis WP1]KPV73137.1 hypothetical protein RHOBADRAFT_55358 [Rhodotorula graminis WP1]